MIIHIFPRSTPQYNREKLLRAGLLIHGVPNNANAPNLGHYVDHSFAKTVELLFLDEF